MAKTPHNIPDKAPIIPDMDLKAAKAYCDTTPIRDPEGIYIWPANGEVVLLTADTHTGNAPTAYKIINLESRDILLSPGQVTGFLFSSPTARDFHLYLYTDISAESVSSPQHMAATYDPSQQVFKFKNRKTKININPLSLIPHMRSLLRIKIEDPVSGIPDGLRRIYPAPHPTPDNPSLPYPRYF